MRTILAFALAAAALATPALAASERFGLEYRVERADAGKLDLATCLATAQRAATSVGYVPAMTKTHPGDLTVFAAGPRGGGGSLTVYCIAAGAKTAYVVQALDYNHPQSVAAKEVADVVYNALLRASR
jgi:hypothetical protein